MTATTTRQAELSAAKAERERVRSRGLVLAVLISHVAGLQEEGDTRALRKARAALLSELASNVVREGEAQRKLDRLTAGQDVTP